MGNICQRGFCNPEEDPVEESLTRSLISPNFPALSFQYTNAKAHKIPSADCAIVSISERHPENQPYFSNVGSRALGAIKTLINIKNPGELQVISNPVASLKLKDIILVNFPLWAPES